MGKFTLEKLSLMSTNLDSMPEKRTDYKGNTQVIEGQGFLEIKISAKITTESFNGTLESVSKKIKEALVNIEY